MYLVIPWLTHCYALHHKINTSGSFSPVSAISPRHKGISPLFKPDVRKCKSGNITRIALSSLYNGELTQEVAMVQLMPFHLHDI